MKRILISISSDPLASGRAAEGLRVADGLSVSEKLEVSVMILGPAAVALESTAQERWIEGRFVRNHLAALGERGIPIYVEGSDSVSLPQALSSSDSALIRWLSHQQEAELRQGVSAVIEF